MSTNKDYSSGSSSGSIKSPLISNERIVPLTAGSAFVGERETPFIYTNCSALIFTESVQFAATCLKSEIFIAVSFVPAGSISIFQSDNEKFPSRM